jgi:hypothetical protein
VDGPDLTELGRRAIRRARQLAAAVVGATLLLVGVVLVFTPGPAIVVWGLGLGVLALEFRWARRWLQRLRSAAKDTLGGSDGESDRTGPTASPRPDREFPPDRDFPPGRDFRSGRDAD